MYYQGSHAVEDYLNKFQTLISEASYTNLCTIVLGTSNSDPEPDCDSAGWEASLCNMSGKAFTFYLAENRAIVTDTLFYQMTATPSPTMTIPVIIGIGAIIAPLVGRTLIQRGIIGRVATEQWVKGGFKAKMDGNSNLGLKYAPPFTLFCRSILNIP